MGEETQLDESHFKVGQKVKCVHSGKEGTVTEVDPSEKGKYYTVKRDDGSIMKYAPDDLEALNEEADLDEASYKVPKNYASMMAKKRRKAGTSEFGTHPDKKKEVKKEEVKLDEADTYAIYKKGKVFDTFRSKEDAHDSLDSMGLSPISKKDYRVRKLPANHKNDWSMKEEVELKEGKMEDMVAKVEKLGNIKFVDHLTKTRGDTVTYQGSAGKGGQEYWNSIASKFQAAGFKMSNGPKSKKNRVKVFTAPGVVVTMTKQSTGIGGAEKPFTSVFMDVKTSNAAMKEEVNLDETNKGATPARYDMIKRAAQRLQGQEDDPRARRAAKRDMKAKGAQRGMAPVKKDLEEGRNEALKALEGLAKSGGMDKADFQKAHDLYKAGKLNDLRKHIYGLDTDPSEAIASAIDRHDSKAFNSMYPRAKGGDYIRKIVLDHGGK